MSVRKFLGLCLLLVATVSYAKNDPHYSPEDLPVPVFDSIGFIIDPDHKIETEWYQEMIGTREIYFFSRYVEPICVRVDNIKNPDDINAYADKLVELWNLEDRTNGRYVFQLQCKSKKKVVYRIGSRLKIFYPASFLRDLARDISDAHLTGEATGTGDFVSIQKLGDRIFLEMAYDTKLTSYDGNTGIHSIYPNDIIKSKGQLELMSRSYYDDHDSIFTNQTTETTNESSVKNYFTPLNDKAINRNVARINTSGVIADIKSVPNQREINGEAVTDPHTILTDEAKSIINQLIKELEDSVGYQIAVVCLNSIAENDPHQFGTDLFNLWGVGQKESDNGLLMLLVVDQHAIEFITGRGTETILTDGSCYDIQQNEMVPYFKVEDYVTGMIRGTQATCDFLYGSPPIYTSADPSVYDTDPYYDETYEEGPGFFESLDLDDFFGYFVAVFVMSGVWLVMLFISFFVRDLHKRYHIMKFFTLMIWMFIFPIPFVAIYFLTKSIMNRWRNTIRFSERTGEEMHKLSDSEEDKHLSKGQIKEEYVKSIDYDVWVTYRGDDILILSYKKWFSKHSKCPKCSFKTYHKLYDRTITSATYESSGTGERCYKCENCGYNKTERYTIPRKTRSSSSSGGSGGGYSRSYSSGGSSYGGGSSRGGGAGSRW